MSVPVVTPPTAPGVAAVRRTPRASGPDRGGSPLVWFVALIVVAVTLGPVLYAVLGGFRTNAQLAESPAGLPEPVGAGQLPAGAHQRELLALRR